MQYQSVLAFKCLEMLQAPITIINHVFTGACNKSVNMGKQLYNSEIHSKTYNLFV